MATYVNIVLGEDDGDDIDVGSVPTREEFIVLSIEGSDGSHQDLNRRSARAGLQRGTVHEPVADDVETLAENPQGDTAEQLETRKKRKKDKNEEKKAEETVAKTPRKRPFDLSHPRPDSRGKEKEDEVEQVRNVAKDVAAGAGGGEAYVEGSETEVESSEATPQQGTIYTKRVRDPGEGGASGVLQSPEFTHV
ncbi:hypothetical protein Hanom_Chr06g00521871 [Helianthus anomalus]